MTNETIEGLLSRCEDLSRGLHSNSVLILSITADSFADLGTEYGTRIERAFGGWRTTTSGRIKTETDSSSTD